MSFREKSAWFVLVGLMVVFGFFVNFAARGLVGSDIASVHYFLLSVIGFVLLQVVLHIVAAALAPQDAHAPVDERERIIALKAARNAGAFLILGVLAVPFSMHLGVRSGPDMGYIAMGALAVSEMVRAASKIVYYRLGR